MLQCNTLDEAILRAKCYLQNGNASRPILINAENIDDYKFLKGALATITNDTVLVSSYCSFKDEIPDMERLFEYVTTSTKNLLLLGLSSYLKLQGEQSFIQEVRKYYSATLSGKLIVLCFQSESLLRSLYENDHRLIQQFLLLDGPSCFRPQITFIRDSLMIGREQKQLFGLKSLFAEMESQGAADFVVQTGKTKSSFPQSITTIREIKDGYSAISQSYKELSCSFEKESGTNEEWNTLLALLAKHTNIDSVFESKLSVSTNFELLINKWISFTSEKKWLLFLALKLHGANQNLCLSDAIRKAKTKDELINQIFRGILEKSPNDLDFLDYYQQRKSITQDFDESFAIDYCNFAKIKGASRIFYLTDNTSFERKQIVECLCEMNLDIQQMESILHVIYPDLEQYLFPYWFNIPILDSYFQQYKIIKLTNHITDDFSLLVEQNAETRAYNAVLPCRSEKTEAIDKKDAYLLFVDALGVEFMGYIMSKCWQYELHAEVSICHSNLPSITSENREFLDDFDVNKTYASKELDEIKHHGAFDFDYRKTKLPIHITKELEIINEILIRAKNQLMSGDIKKIVIISDHGASRMAVISEKELVEIDVDVKGLHSGRCCKYSIDIPHIAYATEERGYYVLANYNRFKGSRAASVEAHGGATLEEVVVPIIELTLSKGIIEVQFATPVIKVSFKNIAEIKLFSKTKLGKVAIRVGDNFYSGTTDDMHTFVFAMPDIKKAGVYHANVYDNNNLIAESLQFVVEKGASKEKDIFDMF